MIQGSNTIKTCVTKIESPAEEIKGLMRTHMCMLVQIQLCICTSVVLVVKLGNIIRSCQIGGNTKAMD